MLGLGLGLGLGYFLDCGFLDIGLGPGLVREAEAEDGAEDGAGGEIGGWVCTVRVMRTVLYCT